MASPHNHNNDNHDDDCCKHGTADDDADEKTDGQKVTVWEVSTRVVAVTGQVSVHTAAVVTLVLVSKAITFPKVQVYC